MDTFFITQEGKEMSKILLSIVLSVLVLSGCSASEDTESIIVGLECAYAPFNWTQTDETDSSVLIDEDGAGYCDGYDIQIAKAIAEEANRTLVVKKIGWDGLIPALTNGEIDMIVAGMTDTEERRQSVAFSDPYYQSDMVLIVRNDSTYASAVNLADFKSASVIAQLNTFHDTIVDQIENVNHLTPLNSFALLTNAVLQGEADAMVSEYPVALSIVNNNPDLTMIQFEAGQGFELSFEDTTVSVATRLEDTELIDTINAVLSTLSQDTRNEMMATAIALQPAE